mmetsp:Transcript_49093/g.128148  ORF Transcript_49093/g.128148 Transcript_49093/m.128148 type:complete len:100 (+) Transcript_49093:131-430(+)
MPISEWAAAGEAAGRRMGMQPRYGLGTHSGWGCAVGLEVRQGRTGAAAREGGSRVGAVAVLELAKIRLLWLLFARGSANGNGRAGPGALLECAVGDLRD